MALKPLYKKLLGLANLTQDSTRYDSLMAMEPTKKESFESIKYSETL